MAAGAVIATGAAAHADTTLVSADNTGILNGTQVFAPIQAPINLCGVSAAVLGEAMAGCEGGAAASTEGLYDATLLSRGNTGILNGTQIFAPIQAPINICGVAAGVLGNASAWCEGGASASNGGGHGHHGGHEHGQNCGCRHDGGHYGESARTTEALGLPLVGSLPLVGGLTSSLPLVGQGASPLGAVGGLTGNLPLLGGGNGLAVGNSLPLVGPLMGGLLGGGSLNRVDVDALDAVGTIDRLSASAMGESTESARITESDDGVGSMSNGGQGGGTGETGGQGGGSHCGTTCPTTPPSHPTPQPCDSDERGHGHGQRGHGHDVTMVSAHNTGILNGTQIYAPVQLPVDVSGIAIGVLGNATAWSMGGASAN